MYISLSILYLSEDIGSSTELANSFAKSCMTDERNINDIRILDMDLLHVKSLKNGRTKRGRKLVKIGLDKPWGVETLDGLTKFDLEESVLVYWVDK